MEKSYAASNAESRMGEAGGASSSLRIEFLLEVRSLYFLLLALSKHHRNGETVCTVFLEEAQHSMYVPGPLSAITNGG